MRIFDKKYLLPFIPFVLTLLILFFLFNYLDSLFSKMDENVYFKIESIIALLVIASYIFVIANTIYYGFDIFRKNEIVIKAKNYTPISKILIRIAFWATWCSILVSILYSIYIFLYSNKGYQDQTSFSKIISYNNIISFFVFIFFLIIDISVYFALKAVSTNDTDPQSNITLDYLKSSIMMIDVPTLLGIVIVFLLTCIVKNYHNNGITGLGSDIYGKIFSYDESLLLEIKHLTVMSFSAGAIAMQVIFSQVIFTILGVKNAESF